MLYGLVRLLVVAFCRFWWRLEVRGAEHLPTTGAFILAPVHRSNADTLVVSVLSRRRMRFMGKHTLWKHRFPSVFLNALGGFPVRRGAADREALRKCAAILEGGEPLVLFPEGTRQSGPRVAELQEGAAYLALRSRVPIIPVGISGSEQAITKGSKRLHRVRIVVQAGAPIVPEERVGRVPRSAVGQLTDRLRGDLEDLLGSAGRPTLPGG